MATFRKYGHGQLTPVRGLEGTVTKLWSAKLQVVFHGSEKFEAAKRHSVVILNALFCNTSKSSISTECLSPNFTFSRREVREFCIVIQLLRKIIILLLLIT